MLKWSCVTNCQIMVETKAAKRKSARKVARRASNEIAIENKKKLGAKKATKKPKKDEKEETSGDDALDKIDLEELMGSEGEGAEESEESDGEGDGFKSQRLVVKLDKVQEKKLKKQLQDIDKLNVTADPSKSSVIYVGRMPYGFFEDEMKGYFSQFGEISRIRVSRNKKTGKSKHYAFIEFEHPEVAEIVATTHDKMLLMDRAIRCAVVPPNKLHPAMWRGANKVFKPANFKAKAIEQTHQKRTREQEVRRVKKLTKKESLKRKQLEKAGIDYEFEGYSAQAVSKRAKKMKFNEDE